MSSSPEPLGLTLTAGSANIAVHSAGAEAVWLCLFDAEGRERRLSLDDRTGDVWHADVPGVRPGDRYGLRVDGPWDPAQGKRFNAAKLLIDPYASRLDRVPRLHPSMFGHGETPWQRDDADSAAHMPLGIAGEPRSVTRIDPGTSWAETVIYELHVRGFTMRHPDIPHALRGTFAGLAHPESVGHLTSLGITAVEVMPCAAWIEERHLAARGLTNYWGYNPIAFLAPDPRLAPGGWTEIAAAVATLARAGIETIVDVVLNHTGEGDALGPTLSLRGIDNETYYRLRAGDASQYVDDTGTGNTLACDRLPVVRLAVDALRAWAVWGGVHGFRFDLGTTLGRRSDGFDSAAPLLSAIAQDPVLRSTKLIAEPWDIGWGGYQLGNFPRLWGEWNDRFRDDVRRFWRGDGGAAGALATRLAGSPDLFGNRRKPSRSINFVVAHDGFTLADLVAHAVKHNEANGEDNRDGTEDNLSWNNGVEGATDDPAIRARRQADQVALLATLILSRGTPMLAMGSEFGHSQSGNNNPYSQDSPVAWLDWAAADPVLLARARALLAARRRHAVLHTDRFVTGTGEPPDIVWLRPDGAAMSQGDWANTDTVTAVFSDTNERVAVVLHRGRETQTIALPAGQKWRSESDVAVATPVTVPARSVTLFVAAGSSATESETPGR